VKLAIVVQRYGPDINGGAELHARYVAEHLARHADVCVLTTCARDYVTWRNELPAGTDRVNGIQISRFPVARPRSPHAFARHSDRVFEQPHSIADELAWLDAEGPATPALVRHLKARQHEYDYFIFFSYRYYHAYHGIRAVASKALLVPTAERDPAIGLGLFPPIFRGARAIMYNSPEERAMIRSVAANQGVPGVVVGIGSEVPDRLSPERFRRKFRLHSRFAIYVGRIDENKGCRELFEFFQRYAARTPGDLTLALVGTSILPVPPHPRIRHLGFVSDQDKFDAMAAADVLIMPSFYESLSMVALEAWALGRPVLANGRCDVLRGQCLRSNAGLYYENYDEFAAALLRLGEDRDLAAALGANGREFFCRHYSWPVIEGKYLDMLQRLQDEDADADRRKAGGGRRNGAREEGRGERLPGWFARRRRTLPPAREVMEALPQGPAVSRESRVASRE
jgi:glycosyltransferase involved in cell wall biosynthesis